MFMETLEINKVEIRNLQKEDYDQLASSFTRVYADGSDVFWTPKQIDKLIRIFPEGQIVVVVDGKIVGCALSIIVNYDDVKNDHTYAQVTGNETFDTTPARVTSSTASRSSSIPTTGDCVWRGACTNTARNCAKNST